MANNRDMKKFLDVMRLTIATTALGIIVGGLVYKNKGLDYPIDVNLVATYLLAGYVFITGLDIYLRKMNRNMGLFLMLCGVLTWILNVLGKMFDIKGL